MGMRKKILGAVMAMSLSVLMLLPMPAYAAEGTDGTEMQVIQPEQLEIQLGADWVGVEFELKTDAGMYPGTIPVGEDGVLRLEIGGSSSYVLTCLNSTVSVPDPVQVPATTEDTQEDANDQTEDIAEAETESAQAESQEPDYVQEASEEPESSSAEESGENTVAGIPVLHLVLFCGGMILAIGSLIVMYAMKRRRALDADYEEDDEE